MTRGETLKDALEPCALNDALAELNRLGYLYMHAKTHENRLFAGDCMWEVYRRIVGEMGICPVLDDRTKEPCVWILME